MTAVGGKACISLAVVFFSVFIVILPVFVFFSICVCTALPREHSLLLASLPLQNNFSYRRYSFFAFASCGLSPVNLRLTTSSSPRSRLSPGYLSATATPYPQCGIIILLLVLLSGDVSLIPGPSALLLSVYYQNVRSIKNKLSICSSHDHELSQFDIFAISETWLIPSVGDSEMSFSSLHCVYRRDCLSRGGGVLVAIKLKLPSKNQEVHTAYCDIVWCKTKLSTSLKSKSNKILVGCFYRPPSSDILALESCLESVLKTLNVGLVILVGD
jgi:hypothetical protein